MGIVTDSNPSRPDRIAALPTPTSIKARFWSGFPELLSPLIGREREIAALRALVLAGETRLITLTGPGGVGKTRLAIAAAMEYSDNFADGAVFVPLAAVRDPADVLSAIARVIGLRESPGHPLESLLAAALRERHLLLVLDNFEHLLPATPVVLRLLEACPRLTVLATSRSALRLSSERRFTTQPLSLPDRDHDEGLEALAGYGAIAFFVERARWVEPEFALTAQNAAAISEICQRLDGLPLAIELAAAWVRVLTPGQLLGRLEPRLPLLRGGATDLPDRLRTMRNAIAWSYDLLTPDEARLFRRLAIFVGGFGLVSAESMVEALNDAGPSDIVQLLAGLIDKSLLHVHTDGSTARFLMLETIREFALERLAESGEAGVVAMAHAAEMTAFALRAEPHLLGPDEAHWHGQCSLELGNLRAALTWSLDHDLDAALRIGGALWAFWAWRHLPEGRRWLTAALSRSAAQDPRALLKGLTTDSALSCLEGDYARCLESANRAIVLGDQAATPEDRALLRWLIGGAYQGAGDLERAAHEMDGALALFEDATTSTNKSWAAYARANRGVFAFALGAIEQGIDVYEEALRRARIAGSDGVLLLILGDYTGWLIQLGRASRAEPLLKEALALAVRVGDFWMAGSPLIGLALLDAMSGNAVRAARRLGAVDAARIAWGLLLPVHIQQRIDEAANLARASLDDDTYEALWEAGRVDVARVVAEAIEHRAGDQVSGAGPNDAHGLSRRQREVLELLVAGRSDRQIAEALFISPRTASHHVSSIMARLGATTRGDAAVRAVRAGLI